MSAVGKLRLAHLCYFSKPASDRRLYRLISENRIHKILEIGVGTLERATRMIDVALRASSPEEISYTGIDLFEARATGPAAPLSLKGAYRILRERGIRAQLLPGDPLSSLARAANSLRETQLVIVSHDVDAASMEQAWFYLPRTIASDCHVFIESRKGGDLTLTPISRVELEKLATRKRARKAA